MSEEEFKRISLMEDYSWKWFSYHATQRLTAFHYFLLIAGGLVVGYIRCVELQQWAVALSLSIFGAVISVAFFCLDCRNKDLVDRSQAGLDKVEDKLGICIRRADDQNRRRLLSHSTWFRLIELLTMGGFLISAVDASQKFLSGWR